MRESGSVVAGWTGLGAGCGGSHDFGERAVAARFQVSAGSLGSKSLEPASAEGDG
jgi:hypothetical protein